MVGPDTRRALMVARRGSVQLGEVGLYKGSPKLDDEEWLDLEMVPFLNVSGCGKLYTVTGFAYGKHYLTPKYRPIIYNIAQDIFTGGETAAGKKHPPLAQLKAVHIFGYACGTNNLEFHATKRVVYVYDELVKHLKSFGVKKDDINKIWPQNIAIVRWTESQADCDISWRDVRVCTTW